MTKLLIILILLFSVNLNANGLESVKKYADQYVADKLKYTGKPTRRILIKLFKFTNVNRKTGYSIGLCYPHAGVIHIDEVWFNHKNINDLDRKQLIYHEMAHCDVLLLHSKTGIMSPNQIRGLNKKQLDALIIKMFKKDEIKLKFSDRVPNSTLKGRDIMTNLDKIVDIISQRLFSNTGDGVQIDSNGYGIVRDPLILFPVVVFKFHIGPANIVMIDNGVPQISRSYFEPLTKNLKVYIKDEVRQMLINGLQNDKRIQLAVKYEFNKDKSLYGGE